MTHDLVLALQQQNRLLKRGLGAASFLAVLALLVAAKGTSAKQRFTLLEAERINIVNPDGSQALVLANRARLPQPVVNGKELRSDRGQMPGMLFYNQAGDECGGLIFDGKLDAKGLPAGGVHLSMDRFGGDQQMALGQDEGGGFMESGLNIYDRGLAKDYEPLYQALRQAKAGPEKEALARRWEESGGRQTQRLFVGKTRGRSSAVILADAQGRPRIMMLVAPEGQPTLNFLDAEGKVLQSLPAIKH